MPLYVLLNSFTVCSIGYCFSFFVVSLYSLICSSSFIFDVRPREARAKRKIGKRVTAYVEKI